MFNHVRVTQDQRQGSADIMGNALNPFRSGQISLPQLIPLSAQTVGGLVDGTGNLSHGTAFREVDALTQGQLADGICQNPHFPVEKQGFPPHLPE